MNQVMQMMQMQNLFLAGKVQTDSYNFKLHCKLSLAIFIFASLITSKGQFFSEPIHCTTVPGVSKEVVDNFCWIHPTYTVTNKVSDKQGQDFAYPGVAPDNVEKRQNSYYQGVSLVLFLQAVSFTIPNYLWKSVADTKIQSLIQNNIKGPVSDPDQKKKELDRLAAYWLSSRGTHGVFALAYFVCELLNLVNAVGQLFLIDKFLGNSFLTLGQEVVEQQDQMSIIFPKMTKCDFWMYAKSGVIEKYDTLCILPINVINEKVYTVIWFWLVCLSTLTAMYSVYLLMVIIMPSFRLHIISDRIVRPVRKEFVASAVHSSKFNQIRQLGDWLVLDILFSNLDQWTNAEIIERIKNIPS